MNLCRYVGRKTCGFLVFFLSLAAVGPLSAQQRRPGSLEIPGLTVPDAPKNLKPFARYIYDKKYKLHFHVPEGWRSESRDGVLSNFGVDTRTTRRGLQVRGVAAIDYNPYPPTTFSGALFYYSVLPTATAAQCSAQTTSRGLKPQSSVTINGRLFYHGRDQHGVGCIESRVDAFTTMRRSSCLRFDLVVNTFCSQTSGAMEITPKQLEDIEGRLTGMLASVTFE